MLATSIATAQFPSLYADFSKLIGTRTWEEQLRLCKQWVKRNPYLEHHLRDEYHLIYLFEQIGTLLKRYGAIPTNDTTTHTLYPAFSFMAQILSMHQSVSNQAKESLVGRVVGAIKDPDAMRGLRLELLVGTHFIQRGCHVRWPELEKIGTYDFLIENHSFPPLEVECKSFGQDKGQIIKRNEALDFFHALKPPLLALIRTMTAGLSVSVTLPNRLPSQHKEKTALAKAVALAILSGQSTSLPDATEISLRSFSPAELGPRPDQLDYSVAREKINAITHANNSNAIIIGSQAGGVLVLAVQSKKDDHLIDAAFRTLKDAAQRQLTGARAGLIVAGFDGLEEDQLESLADHDNTVGERPTSLRIGTTNFLDSDKRNHLIGVGFASRSALKPQDNGVIMSGGSNYCFFNRESRFWTDGYGALFEDVPTER